MHKPLLATIFLALALPSAALSGPTVTEVTAALDRARGASDVAAQVAAIESLASGCKPADYPMAETQLARAYYLTGEPEVDGARKAGYMDKAIAAADRALKADPANAYALYWRSMAKLQKADVVGGLSALSLVKDALKGLEKVSYADPEYDDAGACRSWGKVLIEAPSWAFIGDRKKGLSLLLKAKDISPRSLINRLYLAQAYEKNGKDKDALAELAYIAAAPVDPAHPKDDADIKDEAAALARELK
ncbi:MAG: hypothetical protein HZC51_01870 [Nitrospirae bacterium]|nr:hypothetical protein [Nitrospirota bacterium]